MILDNREIAVGNAARSERPRLAVVGCGAVSRIFHLPAVAASEAFELRYLVDTSSGEAKAVAEQYGAMAVEDYRQVLDDVDAAVVALPNHLHAQVSADLLARGIHVLVEKPMALSTDECNKMISAAERTGAVLAVGLEFRFVHSYRLVKAMLDRNMLGRIRAFRIRQGVMLNWPAASNYLLKKETAGGGVLFDFGPHVLDLVLWWLGDYAELDYRDDAYGGVEANCELRLSLRSGASGHIELSRIRNLQNTCVLDGELGRLEVGLWTYNPSVRLSVAGSEVCLDGKAGQAGTEDTRFGDLFARQLKDFRDAIAEGRQPAAPGREGMKGIELIEACYRSRRRLSFPWDAAANP